MWPVASSNVSYTLSTACTEYSPAGRFSSSFYRVAKRGAIDHHRLAWLPRLDVEHRIPVRYEPARTEAGSGARIRCRPKRSSRMTRPSTWAMLRTVAVVLNGESERSSTASSLSISRTAGYGRDGQDDQTRSWNTNSGKQHQCHLT